jgi:type IV pilus assembly protein PilA
MKRTRNNDRPQQKGKQRGFSLVELLIVVAIILVITAIALPAFNKAKRAANEGAAVQTLKSINTAESTYNTQYDNGYALGPVLAAVGDTCDAAGLLPVAWVLPVQQSGYTFTVSLGLPNPVPKAGCTAPGANTWSATAVPIQQNVTGVRSFYIDQTGIVHYDPAGGVNPSSNSPTLGQ